MWRVAFDLQVIVPTTQTITMTSCNLTVSTSSLQAGNLDLRAVSTKKPEPVLLKRWDRRLAAYGHIPLSAARQNPSITSDVR